MRILFEQALSTLQCAALVTAAEAVKFLSYFSNKGEIPLTCIFVAVENNVCKLLARWSLPFVTKHRFVWGKITHFIAQSTCNILLLSCRSVTKMEIFRTCRVVLIGASHTVKAVNAWIFGRAYLDGEIFRLILCVCLHKRSPILL